MAVSLALIWLSVSVKGVSNNWCTKCHCDSYWTAVVFEAYYMFYWLWIMSTMILRMSDVNTEQHGSEKGWGSRGGGGGGGEEEGGGQSGWGHIVSLQKNMAFNLA